MDARSPGHIIDDSVVAHCIQPLFGSSRFWLVLKLVQSGRDRLHVRECGLLVLLDLANILHRILLEMLRGQTEQVRAALSGRVLPRMHRLDHHHKELVAVK